MLRHNHLRSFIRSLPIQAGLLAGEGLGGVFQALLAVIGVDGGSKCCLHILVVPDVDSASFTQSMALPLAAPDSSSVADHIHDFVHEYLTRCNIYETYSSSTYPVCAYKFER